MGEEPAIPAPDYEEKEEKRDIWGNARRYRGSLEGSGSARETLKAVLKNRPPVAEIVKEITKVVTSY